MTDFQPDVPEEGQEALEAFVAFVEVALRQQDQHVDVGARMQFAAAVAAHRDQVDVFFPRADMQRPGAPQHDVHESRAIAHQRLDRLVVGEALLEACIAVRKHLAKCGNPVGAGVERGGTGFQEGPRWQGDASRGRFDFFVRRGRHGQAGGRSSAPSVNTS